MVLAAWPLSFCQGKWREPREVEQCEEGGSSGFSLYVLYLWVSNWVLCREKGHLSPAAEPHLPIFALWAKDMKFSSRSLGFLMQCSFFWVTLECFMPVAIYRNEYAVTKLATRVTNQDTRSAESSALSFPGTLN